MLAKPLSCWRSPLAHGIGRGDIWRGFGSAGHAGVLPRARTTIATAPNIRVADIRRQMLISGFTWSHPARHAAASSGTWRLVRGRRPRLVGRSEPVACYDRPPAPIVDDRLAKG